MFTHALHHMFTVSTFNVNYISFLDLGTNNFIVYNCGFNEQYFILFVVFYYISLLCSLIMLQSPSVCSAFCSENLTVKEFMLNLLLKKFEQLGIPNLDRAQSKQTHRTHKANNSFTYACAFGTHSNTFCKTTYSTTAVKALDEIWTEREVGEAEKSESIHSNSIQFVVSGGFNFK